MITDDLFKDLVEALPKGVVKITFTKVDGSQRVMLATKNPDLISQGMGTAQTEFVERRAPNPDIVVVFDVEKSAFRSFRKDSVVSFSTDV